MTNAGYEFYSDPNRLAEEFLIVNCIGDADEGKSLDGSECAFGGDAQ
jgi:hypothetical protein